MSDLAQSHPNLPIARRVSQPNCAAAGVVERYRVQALVPGPDRR